MITEWKGDIMEVWRTCSKIREKGKRGMRYVGVDQHKKFSHIAVIDERGRI